MGSTCEIEEGIAVLTNSGSFSYLDVEKALKALTSEPDYRSGMRILFVDKGSDYDPPKDEPERAASMLSAFVPDISDRIAIVVAKDVHYGIARMMQVYCDTRKVLLEIFREEKAAKVWLKEDSSSTE